MRNTRTDNTKAGRRLCEGPGRTGFSLLEVMTSLAILALVASSILLVVDRCLGSAADSALRMAAYQLARENMETILSSSSVKETVDYGNSDRYPDLSWQTVVEAFSEPVSGKMWIRAVCSAEYPDSTGEKQTVELEHWITELTDQQANQLAGEPGSIEELTAEQVLGTSEAAAEYAGVDVETIEKWVDEGLVTLNDGSFLKHNVDVYVRADGKPTAAERKQQVESIEELASMIQSRQEEGQETTGQIRSSDGKDRLTGLPQEQLDKMGVGDVMKLLNDRNKKR
ncbi:MAG: prepilin-type N-terminal cleavage/methylation domain-containing protein [Sedimentisphaerales bacterium]|nr:prepilin-type N-terminal cleavage/methylation domain-containing protein [Sedimentisphaerales bacterium]